MAGSQVDPGHQLTQMRKGTLELRMQPLPRGRKCDVLRVAYDSRTAVVSDRLTTTGSSEGEVSRIPEEVRERQPGPEAGRHVHDGNGSNAEADRWGSGNHHLHR